jgi:hypothetical protein
VPVSVCVCGGGVVPGKAEEDLPAVFSDLFSAFLSSPSASPTSTTRGTEITVQQSREGH